jgi:hypothetical protein
MFQTIKAGLLGLAAVAFATSADAAPIPWSQPSGSTGQISYSNGQSDKGLFGNPETNGNSFLFFPENFEAQAQNGLADTISDRLAFKIAANPGLELKQITVREQGNWVIAGNGSVKSYGTMYITKLNGTAVAYAAIPITVGYTDLENGVSFTSPSRPTSEGSGEWDGYFNINLPAGVTNVQLVLNNILSVTTGTGGAATIAKTRLAVDVFVPEPTALAALGLGGLVLLRRRRVAESN